MNVLSTILTFIIFLETANAGKVKGKHQSDQIDEFDYDSDSSSGIAVKNEESKKILPIVIAGEEFTSDKLFIYREKVEVTVKDCKFRGPVKFMFRKDSSIKFERNICFSSAFFEGSGKLQTKFRDCTFYDSKSVIFLKNSSLDCERIVCSGSALYEAHAELHKEVTVKDCEFRGPVKSIFRKDAFIKFERNKCHESALFEGYKKLQTKFKNCTFIGSKNVISFKNLSVDCERNYCYGSALYMCHAKLHTKFRENKYFASRRICDESENELSPEAMLMALMFLLVLGWGLFSMVFWLQ